jgi:hypothetical protein
MQRRLIRVLTSQRGQTLLVLTFLMLLVIGALATREAMVNAFLRTVSQNTIEDKVAKEMAQSALQEAVDIVRRLDRVLDLNYDGFIDSKDGPYTAEPRQMAGGEYNFRITGHFANERVVYFRFDNNGSTDWSNLSIDLIEDAGSNPLQIGQFAFTAPLPVNPMDFEYHVSMYPGDNLYAVVATLQNISSNQDLWIRVRHADNPQPFTSLGPQPTVDGKISFPVYDPNNPSVRLDITNLVEATEVAGSRAFEDDVFELEASGLSGDQRHNLHVFVRREDLLKYAFFSNTNLVFLSGATINGFVYAGTDLHLNGGDPLKRSTFRKPVRVLGSTLETPNPDANTCGTFNTWPPPLPDVPENCLGDYRRGIAFGGTAITLPPRSSMDEKQIIAADPSEKGGWYDGAGIGPLVLQLNKFDLNPIDGTPIPAYDRGGPEERILPAKFNGLVFSDRDVELIGGTLQNPDKLQGQSLTIYSRQNITIKNSIYTGTTFDTQEPVNLGLVAGGFIYIDSTAPRILHIHAALFAAYPSDPNGIPGGTWAAVVDDSNPRNSHPPLLTDLDPNTMGTDRGTAANLPGSRRDGQVGGCDASGNTQTSPWGDYACNNTNLKEVGVYDIDGDGLIEDANHVQADGTKGNGFGWDEMNLSYDGNNPDDPGHPFFLLIRGPIIIDHTGTAGTWSWLGYVGAPVGFAGTYLDPNDPNSPPRQTRSYQYDPDISRYPPPHFPIPLNATRALTYEVSRWDMRLKAPTPAPTPSPTPDF